MKEKIKLLIAADTYYPKVDGTLRFMEEFMKRSINDFSISLLVPNLGSKKKNPKVKKLTSLAISKVFKISGYPNIKLSLKNIKLIKKSIKEADTIFIQGPALISYLSIYYGHRLKKKTVFYVHVISWELFEKFLPPIINKLFLKIFHKISIIFYNLCDEIFVPYNELKEQLKDNGVKTKMSVARLGVDIEFFSPIIDKKEFNEENYPKGIRHFYVDGADAVLVLGKEKEYHTRDEVRLEEARSIVNNNFSNDTQMNYILSEVAHFDYNLKKFNNFIARMEGISDLEKMLNKDISLLNNDLDELKETGTEALKERLSNKYKK